jgi:hypothetical protein
MRSLAVVPKTYRFVEPPVVVTNIAKPSFCA